MIAEQRQREEPAERWEDRDRQECHAAVIDPAGDEPEPLAEAVGDVVIERTGSVDALGVARDDPRDAGDADRGDDQSHRGGDAGALAGEAEAGDARQQERRREHRADETERLRDHVEHAQLALSEVRRFRRGIRLRLVNCLHVSLSKETGRQCPAGAKILGK